MKKIFFLLFSILVIATACTKDLGKADAKKLIIQAETYPVRVEYEFTKSFSKDFNTEGRGVTAIIGEDDFEQEKKMIETFEKNKLITFEETQYQEETNAWLMGRTIRTWTSVTLSLTEEGKKYLVQENDKTFKVKLWETDLADITGIQEMTEMNMRPQRTAKVDYMTLNKNITPFGESFSHKNARIQKTMYFSLYEDGWRISKEWED